MACVASAGCTARIEDRVAVWVAAEREAVEPILNAFEREMAEASGTEGTFEVEASFDVRGRRGETMLASLNGDEPPPVDLIWDTDVLGTMRLQRQGRLRPHSFDVPARWPDEMIASDGTWCGFATRARVLIVNRDVATSTPESVDDLADPQWRGRCGMATPTRGTSRTHWAVIRARRGEAATLETLRRIRDNADVLANETQVARAVSSGRLAWGLTDSDVAMGEVDLDYPVEVIFPDQASEQPGTLRIPNTVAILRSAANRRAAGRLADFLISSEIEDRLAMGPGSQIPLHRDGKFPPAILPDAPVRWMRADFERAAEGIESWDATVQAELGQSDR